MGRSKPPPPPEPNQPVLETGWSVPPLPGKPEAGAKPPLPPPPGAARSLVPRPPPPARPLPPPPDAFEDVTRVDPHSAPADPTDEVSPLPPGRGNEPPLPPPKKSAKSTQLGLGIPDVAKVMKSVPPRNEPPPRSEPFNMPARPEPSRPPPPIAPSSIAPIAAVPDALSAVDSSAAAEPLDVAAMSHGSFHPAASDEAPPPSTDLVPLAAQLEPNPFGADPDLVAGDAVPLPALFKQRVQLGSRTMGVPLLFGLVAAMVALVAGLVAFLLGTVVGPPEESPRAAAKGPAQAAEVAPLAKDPERASLLERVAGGERSAMQEIETRPAAERLPEETLALAMGQAVRKKEQLHELAASFQKQPKLLEDVATRKKLLEYAENRSTGLEALRVIAAIDGPLSADLLYEVWTGTTTRNEVTELAEALLYSKAVRPKASKPLAVALDLRKAEQCDQYQAIIPRAREEGDRRSLHLLARLMRRFGCGPKKTGDCYKCLRDSDDLKDALKVVKTRPAPVLR